MLAAGAAFVAVALATVSVALLSEWIREQWRRVTLRRQLAVVQAMASAREAGLLRGGHPGRLDPLVTMARRFGPFSGVEATMVQAGTKWSFGTFLLVSFGVALTAGLAFLALTRSVLIAVLLGGIASLLPHAYLIRRRQRRLNEFEEGLPDALDLLGRAIRAGHPISSGIKIVADETREPVAGEFQRTFEEQRFGLPFEDSLLAMLQRVPLVDLRLLVTAILIQREVGGNLAEVLDNLSDVIRQRFMVHRQLRTYTAQGRLSGYILALLPIVVGAITYLINAQYVRVLFVQPFGRMMLGIAVTMQLVGFFWIRRIVDIEF